MKAALTRIAREKNRIPLRHWFAPSWRTSSRSGQEKIKGFNLTVAEIDLLPDVIVLKHKEPIKRPDYQCVIPGSVL